MIVNLRSGFADLLRIGNQSRPAIFDLQIARPGRLNDVIKQQPALNMS